MVEIKGAVLVAISIVRKCNNKAKATQHCREFEGIGLELRRGINWTSTRAN